MSCSHQCKRAGKRGAMLLELTCALFIITAGLFGVLQMYGTALDHTRHMIQADLASTVLENEMETLHGLGFAALKTGRAPFFSDTPERERLHGLETYLEISPTPGAERFARTVILILRWQAQTGRTVEKRLATIIADRGTPATRPGDSNDEMP